MRGALRSDGPGQLAQGGGQAEGQELERHRGMEPLDRFVGGHDDHETSRRRRHDALAGMGPTAALDEPSGGIHLVGAVDGQVEPVDLGEGPDDQPWAAASSSVAGDVATQVMSSRRAPRAGTSSATVVPVPSPTAMPFSTSCAAVTAAVRFSAVRSTPVTG